MLTTILIIFASVFFVSLLSLVGVLTLWVNHERIQRFSLILVALATGALLGDAFLHLIPEAFAQTSNATVTALLILAGILIVMVFERFLWWHHDHHERDSLNVHDAEGRDVAAEEHARIEPIGRIVMFSDGFHNFLDGMAIAAAFLVSTEIGLATTLAIVFHEIPQEIGDFGILLHAGYSRTKALVINLLSALTAVLGAGVALLFSAYLEGALYALLPIAAGSFIYIALADLIPELHRRREGRRFVFEMLFVLLGIAIMFGLLFVEFPVS